MTVHITLHTGDRDQLRPLFALAEDSTVQLDAYLYTGRVLVAVGDGEPIGHLQLVATDRSDHLEIKNMGIHPAAQRQGLGSRLVRAAFDLAAAEGVATVVVATAAADTGNLRFYQRLGFRLRSVERDAFTPATGYPDPILIDGIELRDRVWLDRPVR